MTDALDRALVREATEAAQRLSPVAARVLEHRGRTLREAEQAGRTLRARVAGVHPPGSLRWRVLPLEPGDGPRLGALAAAVGLEPMTEEQERLLRALVEDVPETVRRTRPLHGLRRLFLSGRRREEAEGAARQLLEGYAVWGSGATTQLLARWEAGTREPTLPVALAQAWSDHVGLTERLGGGGTRRSVVPLGELAGLPGAARSLAAVIGRELRARQAAVDAGEAVRESEADRLVAQMPVDRLREATRERLRVGALTEAGITTVGDVLARGTSLSRVPGVGEVTARRMLGAAETLRTLAREDARVTLDPARRDPAATRLLGALHTWEMLRQAAKATDVVALAQVLLPLADRLTSATTHLAVLSDGPDADDLRALVTPLLERARELDDALRRAGAGDPWTDFVRRPADYFALLSELGLVEETGVFGDLPDDVVEAVRAQELDGSLLTVSLRGYQSFAARFALVQEKVLVGDEMGLGKTIEGLAVLAHLAMQGGRWFLVVCPAAVVSNWVREVHARTDASVRAHRVHGPGREEALARWRRDGGVAVTTYETLGSVWDELTGFELDALVVDEAHYVKNPRARRSQRIAALAARTEHVVLLTGTPLENRTAEFGTLVGYLRPELVAGLGTAAAADFRRAVAPVYLRRNTEDVLVELPELVEVDEWLELSAADRTAYRDAVADGNFMAMRRAAFVAGAGSAKLQRLVELVAEAEDNGRRLLVFSYFRDVLEEVAAALPGPVFGPITGSVPATERQRVVDDFSAARGGAALVAQIQAGGVGLNIQAASVVVLCEPQVKPTTEWQAIARARRMGQLESVQVHRLLAEDSVDERMVEILSGKSEIFHRFARVSDTAQAAPEAFDVSEADLARRVVAAERARLFPEGA
ncbi:DEAD/DEAH box helicase [Ornithinimicrobium flavum]|uniref:DEAD/DEAH box helicase n=1 Tax=Ornithinimicrobium flavum TaxID=1288636 RepID=UPI00106F2DB3|nr:DEAD/DEAH box helicase [Ornithinimicrobium flavum]